MVSPLCRHTRVSVAIFLLLKAAHMCDGLAAGTHRHDLVTGKHSDDIHVHAGTPPGGDGTAEHPFTTLDEAKVHIVTEHLSYMEGQSLDLVSHRRVLIHPGEYGALALDHPALSNTAWIGADDDSPPVLSGGVEIPLSRFSPYKDTPGAYVASIAGLTGGDFGQMVSGNEVVDCQHDKVGVSYNGNMMTLARWPNADPGNQSEPYKWARAHVGGAYTHSAFYVNTTESPEFVRMLRWRDETDPWLHGYFEWDWADCYGRVTDIGHHEDTISVNYDDVPDSKDGARWMGVNLLCELDQPGEYYVDADNELVYLYPPSPVNDSALPIVKLMYQRGGVVNVTQDAKHVTLSNLDIRDGRHAGILAPGAKGLTVANVLVHAHGTDGIVLTNAQDSSILNSEVYDVGCTGIRATGGDAATLAPGNLSVKRNTIHHFALWKRSYMPGVYWGGVSNTFVGNSVYFGPHNGFLGGGDFEDGVNNVFEENILADLTFETIDSGGFYTCGQRGAAFTNRGNILHNNTFERIRNTAGVGFQIASNQAVYLDDQMSAWVITSNIFKDSQVCSFIGGGRRNKVSNNVFVRCGTVQYMNNQGMTFDSGTVNCSDVAPPFSTMCSTGAATWMTLDAPAAKTWASSWPEMTRIGHEYCGYPAFNEITNNTICECPQFSNASPQDFRDWKVTVTGNVYINDC